MDSSFVVFLPGYASSDARAVDALTESTGLSRIDAKLILASSLPRQVYATKTCEEAEDRALSLRGAGFDAFVLSREALGRVRPPQVSKARFVSGGIEFEPAGSFRAGELRLILHGVAAWKKDVQTTHTTQYTFETRTETEHVADSEDFVHLYGSTAQQALAIRARSFDFHCLGREFGLTAAANLNKFVEKLRDLFPDAVCDDRLVKKPPNMEDLSVTGSLSTGTLGTSESVIRDQSNEDPALRAAHLLALWILRK